MRLLLIEDDPLLGQGIVDALENTGDSVDWLQDGKQGLNAILASEFDALILDLGLPGISGLDVLKKIRAKGKVLPVLILTARDGISDRITGLDMGADDYLAKPFDIDELQARLRAITRRQHQQTQPTLSYKDIVVDPANRQVLYREKAVELSRREYNLLVEFLSHPNRVFNKDLLAEKLYSWDDNVESNAIEVHIHHLRKKFGKDFLKTVRGVGYRLS